MSNTAVSTYSRDFVLSDAEFRRIRELVAAHTGISLSEAKHDLVYGRLVKRVRALRLSSFDSYCDYVENDGGEEIEHFTNAITTNLTSFFREAHHFEYLRNNVIPELLKRNRERRRIRIWSAGCSSGEEPYSIAITLREAMPEIGNWDVKILATDLDSNCLARGANGVYDKSRFTGMNKKVLRKWFLKGKGAQQGQVAVSPKLAKLIAFRRLNLMHEWPMRGPFDVIFCRNVVIYFDKLSQRTLFERYAELMSDGAYLFLGHSESLYNVSDRFKLIGETIYRKR